MTTTETLSRETSSERFEDLYPKTLKENLVYRAEVLYGASNSKEKQFAFRAACERNCLFWINTFIWTYNPRITPADIPFITYPFQDSFIQKIQQSIEAPKDLLVDKSRDMGVTWSVLMVFLWMWQFGGVGQDFLVGSRKEQYVDKHGDMDTLLEKVRFALKRQPRWLLPKGFDPDRDTHYMNLINPETGSNLAGESTNENFARGARRRAILLDEFAFWDVAQSAWRSAADTTNSRIAVSTPHGLNNHFAKLRFSENIEVHSLHWKLHPEKDDKWYAQEEERRSHDKVEIAQELDINYEASEAGILFPWEDLRRATTQEISFSPDKVAIGFDPAGEGEDEGVIYCSNNGNIIDRKFIRKTDAMGMAGEVVAMAHRHKAQVIVGDAIGNDSVNGVQHLLGTNPQKIKVIAFKGSEKAKDPVRFYNARAELYFEAAQKLKSGNVQTDDDYTLLRQLNATKYDKKDGRFILQKKEQIKQVVGSSPDRADAWVLAVKALELTHSRREVKEHERYRTTLEELNTIKQGSEYGDWHDDPGGYV